MTMDPNAWLMGGGGRSAEFKEINDEVWGVIMGMEMRQQTKVGTGELLFWKDGNPRMQMVVTLLTEQHVDEDDDGLRKLYIRGAMQKAVQSAVLKTKARGLAEGGKLFVRHTAVAAPAGPGLSGEKQYFAKYEPPVVAVSDADYDGDGNPLPF